MNPNSCKKLLIAITIVSTIPALWLLRSGNEYNNNSVSFYEQHAKTKNTLDRKSINEENRHTEQDDPELVQFVRDTYLKPPQRGPSIITQNAAESAELRETLLHLLINTKNGFFVQAGAYNGCGTTLTLELTLNWTGLLIEPAKNPFIKLEKLNRKAWITNVAVSSEAHSRMATFFENAVVDLWGGLTYRFYKYTEKQSTVQCIPLYTLILATHVTEIDLLMLDMEGTELDVLRTIPIDKLGPKVVSVEVNNGKEGPTPLKELMSKNGYSLYKTITVPLGQKAQKYLSPLMDKSIVNSVYYVFTKDAWYSKS